MTVSLLVNGRTPSPPSFCALCGEPIRESYLREVATRLCYCSYECTAITAIAPTKRSKTTQRHLDVIESSSF
jgi:hypothetical protein